MTDDLLEQETRAILDGWPFVLVRRDAGGFVVGLGRTGIERVGHTGIDPNTSDDPRDLARRLLAQAGGAPVALDEEPPLALSEDEDPGEQPEIFTEEDLEAIDDGAVAATDSAEVAPTGDNPVDLSEVGEVAPPIHGGMMIERLDDDLGRRRNQVLAAITTEKLTRLSVAMDPSRADFLATRFADYQNAGALGLPIDEVLAADYHAFQELRDRRDRITNYAMQLEQSALDGDMDRLSAMHAGLSDGWP